MAGDSEIVVSLLLRDEMTQKMKAARDSVDAMSDAEKKGVLAAHEQAAALTKVEDAATKTTAANKGMGISMLEINAAMDVASKAIGAVKGAYDAIIAPTMEYAAQIRTMSRTIGATAEESSVLIQVADDVGVSVGTLQNSLEAAIRKGVEPSVEGLGKLADEYNTIQDPIEKTKFLMDKFGRAGADLAPMMAQGSAGIREAGQAAKELGLILDEEAVKKARQFEVAMDDLGDSALGIKYSIGNAAIPALTGMAGMANENITTLLLLKQGMASGSLSAGEYAEALAKLVIIGGTGAISGKNMADMNDELKQSMKSGTEQIVRYSEAGASAYGVTVDLTKATQAAADKQSVMAEAVSENTMAVDDYRKASAAAAEQEATSVRVYSSATSIALGMADANEKMAEKQAELADVTKGLSGLWGKAADAQLKHKDALESDIEAMKAMQKATEGKDMMSALNKALQAGTLSADEYAASIAQVNLTYKLFTAEELKAATSHAVLMDALGNATGTQSANEAMRAYYLSIGDAYSALMALVAMGGDVGGPASGVERASAKGEGKGYARGGDFIVPAGYPGDRFPISVSSGERVTITPQGSSTTNTRYGDKYNVTINDTRAMNMFLDFQRRQRATGAASIMG